MLAEIKRFGKRPYTANATHTRYILSKTSRLALAGACRSALSITAWAGVRGGIYRECQVVVGREFGGGLHTMMLRNTRAEAGPTAGCEGLPSSENKTKTCDVSQDDREEHDNLGGMQ